MIKDPVEYVFSVTESLSGIVTIPWIWICVGTVVWAVTIWISVRQAEPSEKEMGAIIGSIFGLVLGVFSPFFIAILPLVISTVLVIVLVAGLGLLFACLVGMIRK